MFSIKARLIVKVLCKEAFDKYFISKRFKTRSQEALGFVVTKASLSKSAYSSKSDLPKKS